MPSLTDSQLKSTVFWGMALIAIGLPLSRILMSIGTILLVTGWLFQRNYAQRFKQFISDPIGFVFAAYVSVFIIGLGWSSNFGAGLTEAKVQLPILVIPLALFTSKLPDRKRVEQIFLLFITACMVGILIGLLKYTQLEANELIDKRQLSPFVSHIRFGLMLVFAFFILAYFLFEKRKKWSNAEKLIALISMGLILAFMIMLESITAYIAFVIVLAIIPFFALQRIKSRKVKLVVLSSSVVIILGCIVYGNHLTSNYFYEVPWNYKTQTNRTLNDNVYAQHKDVLYKENGHRVWNYICWEELKREWPKRSSIGFEELDQRNQPIKFTILRYMTSKGMMKDSAGIHHLTNQDIENIEAGFTNYKYTGKLGIARKGNEILRGIERYLWINDANNSSGVMRWIYFKIGTEIVKENLIFGVGTGDLKPSYKEQYAKNNFGLEEQFQDISHNQFLTTAISLGILGLVCLLLILMVPFWLYKRDFLMVVFTIILLVSFMTDNTLGRQAGVTLFAFFTSLIIVRLEQAELA